MMKRTYRITTIIFLVILFLTAITDLMRMDFVLTTVRHLGYPDFLPLLIGTGKCIGIILLSLPRYTPWKEWGYAGFTVLFLSAAASHAFAGDALGHILPPLIFETLLLVSYFSMRKVVHNATA
ncbi:DoxX family protein [Chitinophaga nivalis]|uniref:DoxX family protein n=1 Tax=Chitinophaga nivalis TaxID=2991709 RepID=A0ABT3IM81_9BACT|nr:DoxX family protein [Chitinophaga nivalis]MCW3465470.1 DoxX family protein [Chitinophaga nivalis]MCW3484839.1 DoxX family protein [Chitinophaga nivalis]